MELTKPLTPNYYPLIAEIRSMTVCDVTVSFSGDFDDSGLQGLISNIRTRVNPNDKITCTVTNRKPNGMHDLYVIEFITKTDNIDQIKSWLINLLSVYGLLKGNVMWGVKKKLAST